MTKGETGQHRYRSRSRQLRKASTGAGHSVRFLSHPSQRHAVLDYRQIGRKAPASVRPTEQDGLVPSPRKGIRPERLPHTFGDCLPELDATFKTPAKLREVLSHWSVSDVVSQSWDDVARAVVRQNTTIYVRDAVIASSALWSLSIAIGLVITTLHPARIGF